MLCVQVGDELVIFDSTSDVSLGRMDMLNDVHDSYEQVQISHLDGHMVYIRRGSSPFLMAILSWYMP